MMTMLSKLTAVRVARALLGFVALGVLGCDASTEAVCRDVPRADWYLAATSVSDLDTSRDLAPDVARQAAERAADTCGVVIVGLITNRATADLEVFSKPLVPEVREAVSREPVVRPMEDDARRFLNRRLVQPLDKIKPTSGSPFVSGLVAAGREMRSQDLERPNTVLYVIGDWMAIERSPSGRKVDFRAARIDDVALNEFVTDLRPLAGACVIAVGFGAGSGLLDERLRQAEKALRRMLRRADVRFEATRSRTLPAGCKAAT